MHKDEEHTMMKKTKWRANDEDELALHLRPKWIHRVILEKMGCHQWQRALEKECCVSQAKKVAEADKEGCQRMCCPFELTLTGGKM